MAHHETVRQMYVFVRAQAIACKYAVFDPIDREGASVVIEAHDVFVFDVVECRCVEPLRHGLSLRLCLCVSLVLCPRAVESVHARAAASGTGLAIEYDGSRVCRTSAGMISA